MSAETKEAMQQAVVQSYQNAFKTHEACLAVLREEGDKEAVTKLKEAIKQATKIQSTRKEGAPEAK